MDSLSLRRLSGDDAPAYRDLRLEALRLEPQAFGSSWEEEAPRSMAEFATRLVDTHVIGALTVAGLVGMVGLQRSNRVKTVHIGSIWGMYVRPAARGRGIGRRLLTAAIAEAGPEVRSLRLAVEAENLPARRLYESVGFVAWAREAEALRIGDTFHDEILMRLEIR